jgi:nucleoid DNA-binding protein
MSKKFKVDLIAAVAARAEITKIEAKRVLEIILDEIPTLAQGDGLTISDFGTFKYKTRAARAGRNPMTGAALEIPEQTSLGFKATKHAK